MTYLPLQRTFFWDSLFAFVIFCLFSVLSMRKPFAFLLVVEKNNLGFQDQQEFCFKEKDKKGNDRNTLNGFEITVNFFKLYFFLYTSVKLNKFLQIFSYGTWLEYARIRNSIYMSASSQINKNSSYLWSSFVKNMFNNDLVGFQIPSSIIALNCTISPFIGFKISF